ncbi:MAG TPA: hypothetical protein VM686_15790 [Polyangiaceae bacterium]|nr:hypothetical protein [Polyangiaceae bacterium]
MSSARIATFFLLAFGVACQQEGKEAPGARPSEPSPNASILPAPLASDLVARPEALDSGIALGDAGVDAGSVVPQSVRADRMLPDDDDALREAGGTLLRARWRWLDVALPSRLPEANVEAVDRVRAELGFDFDVELTAGGRMRLVLAADTFVLPRGTELRARLDLYGHALLWPDKSKYALLAPGTLRALFNEHRSDVIPLTRPKPSALGGGEVLGLATERQRLATPHGRIDLDQARQPGGGLGGMLLCRTLIELLAVHPDSSSCAADLLPLRAEYTWADGSRAAFEVVKQSRASDLDSETFALPPPRALFARGELPPATPPPLVADEELGRFRLRPLPKPEKNDKGEKRDGPTVKEGLLVVNRGELSAFLLIDGVPVLRAAPRSDDYSLPLVPGTYFVAAREFLGTVTLAQSALSVPGRVVLSEVADAER